MKLQKRKVDVVVLSDVHLGTYGCKAKELLQYLKSIDPGKLVLNGDIIDIWQFKKNYWPKSHMLVIKHITTLLTQGVPVHYITGNHDEMMRKFAGLQMGNLSIQNKLILDIKKDKAWVFHGDVFDVSMQHSKWIAKLGAIGYDFLILFNRLVNFFWEQILGKSKVSLSKKIKDSVKRAVKYLNDFELTAAEIAIDNHYKYVICGHVHKPEIRNIQTEKGTVTYLNSGDWVENMSALEYNKGEWELYRYTEDELMKINASYTEDESILPDKQELFKNLMKELTFVV
ncbi:UDP-2,3-diacylglucosamine diphosphatase [Chondrinema litorale]|uniref:UDP-2,3-diacylglucosamine diphosphatase n=1 Tax=Chondrinema litorale TaxID=2994555 RepID=UPI0025437596|nr:UDP-2,3-diacylglucosamine diphosphatase [Chondrinema litorale]UZR93648.1 UDP-2,3-diacylglucosamine diphosphatase [Chondrinema litorale]